MDDAPSPPAARSYPDPDARPQQSARPWNGPRTIRLTIGEHVYAARLEVERAPLSCGALLDLLPLTGTLLQTRWSGEAAWVPLGAHDIDVPYENHTTYPLPSQLLLFRGGISQPELLLAYGTSAFGSKVGPLAGNHVATLICEPDRLALIGQLVLWEGAQDILIELA